MRRAKARSQYRCVDGKREHEWHARTRWSVSHNLPVSFIFFAPPDPPALAPPVGGASGTTRESSTPPFTSLIVSSFGSGMGARAGLSIAQLSAIVSVRGPAGYQPLGMSVEKSRNWLKERVGVVSPCTVGWPLM